MEIAKMVAAAGKTSDGKYLFAIIDKRGHTKYQVWTTVFNIKKQYEIR